MQLQHTVVHVKHVTYTVIWALYVTELSERVRKYCERAAASFSVHTSPLGTPVYMWSTPQVRRFIATAGLGQFAYCPISRLLGIVNSLQVLFNAATLPSSSSVKGRKADCFCGACSLPPAFSP